MTTTTTFHAFLRQAGAIDMPPRLSDYPMAFEPRQDQVDALGHLLRNTHFGLFSDAGVGKTVSLHATMLYRIGYGHKVVCLMPPAIIYQFLQELGAVFLGSDAEVTLADFTQTKAKRERMKKEWDETSWPDILAMSYTMFTKHDDLLGKKGYKVLVCDEAQNLRGHTSAMHNAAYWFTFDQEETSLILSTGTPIHSTLTDAFGVTRLINRDAYYNYDAFRRRHEVIETGYASVTRTKRGITSTKLVKTKKVSGYKNIDKLKANLYKNAFRVTKDQVLNLKRPSIITQDVGMHPEHRRLYRKMLKERMMEIQADPKNLDPESGKILLTAELEVQLRHYLMGIACNPNNYLEVKEDGKVRKVTNALEEAALALRDAIPPERKVLMFGYHHETVDNFYDLFEANGDNPVRIYGGQYGGTAKNAAAIKAFQQDDDVRVCIGHPLAGGVGANYQYVCSDIIVIEPWSIPGDFTQALARVQREGQKHPVTCWLMSLMGTAFPAMIDTMLDRNRQAAEANGDVEYFLKYVEGAS